MNYTVIISDTAGSMWSDSFDAASARLATVWALRRAQDDGFIENAGDVADIITLEGEHDDLAVWQKHDTATQDALFCSGRCPVTPSLMPEE